MNVLDIQSQKNGKVKEDEISEYKSNADIASSLMYGIKIKN